MRTVKDNLGRHGKRDASCPLTPALSLGERENRSLITGDSRSSLPLPSVANNQDARTCAMPSQQSSLDCLQFPLPKGEGQGEGERGWLTAWRARSSSRCSGITVLELMIVISIIAVLSVLAVPAIRGFTRSNTVASASRQVVDDFALARQRAINGHSIVHVVFVPPWKSTLGGFELKDYKFMGSSPRNSRAMTNIWTGGQTRYALYAERTAGDQPGQHKGRYLTPWRTLPDGIFIPEWQLLALEADPVSIPFPTSEGWTNDLPHISFDQTGGLVDARGNRKLGELLHLARGSVMFQRDPNTGYPDPLFDARENPANNSRENFNRVRIDGLTGRTKVERPEIQ